VKGKNPFARARIPWIRASKRHQKDASKEAGNFDDYLARKSKFSNKIDPHLPIPTHVGPLLGLAFAKQTPDWGCEGDTIIVVGPWGSLQ
jgi:hypothetical protein